jgi:hypothetical protein
MTHFKEKEKSGERGQSFLVKVETSSRWGSTPYFLSLWIDSEAKMYDLDIFLRGIWLECCGHLSAFRDPSGRISSILCEDEDEDEVENDEEVEEDKDDHFDLFGFDDGEDEDDIPKDCKVGRIFYQGLKLEYEYDFGSTTELSITVLDEYMVKADSGIVLLSRNEPLKIMCAICGEAPATQICMVCMYQVESEFCDKCAKKHAKKCEDFKDYASMPVVNSPRAGVCGYDGGVIDTERDGVYQLK